MTIARLIRKLQNYPGDCEIIFTEEHTDNEYDAIYHSPLDTKTRYNACVVDDLGVWNVGNESSNPYDENYKNHTDKKLYLTIDNY